MYKLFVKRLLDILLSGMALIVLSPILVILMILGAFFMHGSPFFIYPRVGRNEKVFKLIKFRSMAELKDDNGEYLPDEIRLNKYGRLLRAASLDELPELINIFIGDMSIVGPRPLPCRYLDYYTKEERHRHDVRPGLTGLAQVNGRNNLSWEDKFAYDLKYVNRLSFAEDCRIIIKTAKEVLTHEGIGQGKEMPASLHEERKDWVKTANGAVKPDQTGAMKNE